MEDFNTLRRRSERIQGGGEVDKYRTLLRRIGAGMIDAGILVLVQSIIFVLVNLISLPGKFLFVITITQLLTIVYNVVFIATISATPGKMLFGLKILDFKDEDNKVGIEKSFLREILNSTTSILYVGMIVTYSLQGRLGESDQIMYGNFNDTFHDIVIVSGSVIFLSEIVTAAFSSRRRALHDFVAGTVVVKHTITNRMITAVCFFLSVGAFYIWSLVFNYFKAINS